MPSSRVLNWHTAAVCTVPVAAAAVALLIGGVNTVAPPLEIPQAVDPLVAVTTTTTLAVSPPVSPIVQGTPVTLVARITPQTAVGTVQFKDGTTNLGSPVPVSNNGTAAGFTTMLAAGSRQLTAVFTPTDQANFTSSTSEPVTVTIATPSGAAGAAAAGAAGAAGAAATSAATATNTELATSPMSTVAAGSPLTLNATVTPATAIGTVQFRDGTTNLGNPVTVTNGTASGTVSTLAVGGHQLTAVFTPTNSAVFSPSTSSPVMVTVVGAGSSQALTTQESGLSLDVRLSILGDNDKACDLDGRRSLLDVSMPVLDNRGTVVAGRLSVLDGSVLDDRRGLLNGVVTVVLG